MTGFSTEEDSREGPPAAPAAAPGYGQSCCLIEDGERCVRPAGNASFSKRVQKSISQKKLKLDIDKSVSPPSPPAGSPLWAALGPLPWASGGTRGPSPPWASPPFICKLRSWTRARKGRSALTGSNYDSAQIREVGGGAAPRTLPAWELVL